MTLRKGAHAEGVIKFEAAHEHAALDHGLMRECLLPVLAWREVLWRLGLIGRDPQRYDGAAFGNVSVRVPPYGLRPTRRAFLVSGTQTGGAGAATPADFALVTAYDVERNTVASRGEVLPSSEALTHGTLYDLDADVRCVLHVHAPELWRLAPAMSLPTTDASAAYGTVQMAREVRRLARANANARIFAMGGHEDGILSIGRTADEAGGALLRAFTAARARTLGSPSG